MARVTSTKDTNTAVGLSSWEQASLAIRIKSLMIKSLLAVLVVKQWLICCGLNNGAFGGNTLFETIASWDGVWGKDGERFNLYPLV